MGVSDSISEEKSGDVTGDFLILPNFCLPEPEKSEALIELMDELPLPLNENFSRTYGLRGSNGQESNVTVGYIFDPTFKIPDKLQEALKDASEFFGMLPPSDNHPIVALFSLVPYERVSKATFHRKTMMDEFVADEPLDYQFIVIGAHNYSEMLNSWYLTDENREREPREKLIFLERNRGLCTTHYCEEFFKLKLCEGSLLPRNTQHLAVRNQGLFYATPREVAATSLKAKLYKRSAKTTIGFWPPQLARCGRSIYWSRYNGKELMRWKDSDGNDYHEAAPVCDLREHGLTVRRIAASDSTEIDNLAVVARSGNLWKILFFPDVNTGKFVDLGCPLRTIDSIAVMKNVVYALGSELDSLFPDVVRFYKDGCWSEPIKRIEDVLPTVFFPLNGRLYIFCNGFEYIECFDPETNAWTLRPCGPGLNDICGVALFNTPAPASLRSEI